MERLFISLILSLIVTVIFFVFSAMYDGACHCMKAMYTFFPYGTAISMRGRDALGLLLTFIQLPLYTVIIITLRKPFWKIAVLLVIIAIHAIAAYVALQSYYASRHQYAATMERTDLQATQAVIFQLHSTTERERQRPI